MIYYKDFGTGKRRWTHGKPDRVERGGLMNCMGLVCKNKASEIWIPEYLLEPMGREILNSLQRKELTP